MTEKLGSKERRGQAVPQEISEPPSDVKAMSIEEQVEYLAGLQFTMIEVELVVGQPIEDILEQAYMRGALLEEAKVREAIKRLAVRGSSPAQRQYIDMVTKTKKRNR
jgi:hypothetical protein